MLSPRRRPCHVSASHIIIHTSTLPFCSKPKLKWPFICIRKRIHSLNRKMKSPNTGMFLSIYKLWPTANAMCQCLPYNSHTHTHASSQHSTAQLWRQWSESDDFVCEIKCFPFHRLRRLSSRCHRRLLRFVAVRSFLSVHSGIAYARFDSIFKSMRNNNSNGWSILIFAFAIFAIPRKPAANNRVLSNSERVWRTF